MCYVCVTCTQQTQNMCGIDHTCKVKSSINTKLKEAHNNYHKRLFDNSFSGNRRQSCKYVTAKHQDKHDISTLFIDDQPIHSGKGKANALNSSL